MKYTFFQNVQPIDGALTVVNCACVLVGSVMRSLVVVHVMQVYDYILWRARLTLP